MCTAISIKGKKNNYFGRTLDVEVDYPTSVVVCPRNFVVDENLKSHYAIIGMAMVLDDYPLFFDASNEFGLAMAGLNFPDNACYFPDKKGKLNLPCYKLIPYILGRCKTVAEAKKMFSKINITTDTFSSIPNSPLHYIVSDGNNSITVEQTKNGLKIFDNIVGVLTNNPTFDWHMTNLVNYLNVTDDEAKNRMLKNIPLKAFCKGLGGVGLPGDLSSPSRFVRVTFSKNRALLYDNEEESVSQFFHILGGVAQTTGLAKAGKSYEKTLYTSCINTTKGIYYYITYFNSRVVGVDMAKHNLDGKVLSVYPLNYKSDFLYL